MRKSKDIFQKSGSYNFLYTAPTKEVNLMVDLFLFLLVWGTRASNPSFCVAKNYGQCFFSEKTCRSSPANS